jgi:putative Holliday junction resolvase
MERIICLDVGQSRVGVAVSDPLGLTAQPVETVSRKPHGLFLETIASLAARYETKRIVLGLPTRTDGSTGPEAQRIMALAHELKAKLGLEAALFDERLTTVMAERSLDEAGVRGEARRRVVDQAAAAIILTGHLALLARSAAAPEAAAEAASGGPPPPAGRPGGLIP